MRSEGFYVNKKEFYVNEKSIDASWDRTTDLPICSTAHVYWRRIGISYIAMHRLKSMFIGHILRRDCLLKHVIEGVREARLEMTGRRGRRLKQLQDGHKETRGCCKLKDETLDYSMWGTGFGWTCGQFVQQATR